MERLKAKEAAKILGISPSYLRRLAANSVLSSEGGYNPEEVAVLKDLRKKAVTLTDLAAVAYRAHMTAFRAERHVKQLADFIGVDQPILDLGEDAVLALHLKANDLLQMAGSPSAEDMTDWARIFQAMGEEYFEVASMCLGSDEPWRPYVELSSKLSKDASRELLRVDRSYKHAFNHLQEARRGLRITASMYVSRTRGKTIGLRAFPELKGDAHESILEFVEICRKPKSVNSNKKV